MLSLDKLVEKIKTSPQFSEVGMIACHLGVVRGYSREGKPVETITIQINQKMIEEIVNEAKRMPGIFDVLVEAKEGTFVVGEPIMAVAVAGNFRENVFKVLEKVVNSIKTKAIKKQEKTKGGEDGQ